MKKCSFCAEEIQDKAIKCKYCGEFIDLLARPHEEKIRWYFRTGFIVTIFCFLGPLGLPLIWLHPVWDRKWKVVITIVTMVLSWWLFKMMMESIHNIEEYYKFLDNL